MKNLASKSNSIHGTNEGLMSPRKSSAKEGENRKATEYEMAVSAVTESLLQLEQQTKALAAKLEPVLSIRSGAVEKDEKRGESATLVLRQLGDFQDRIFTVSTALAYICDALVL